LWTIVRPKWADSLVLTSYGEPEAIRRSELLKKEHARRAP
jgi:hypothetical protein